jgi:hypothetical protein
MVKSDISHTKESNETATNTDENLTAYMHQNGFKYRKVSCLTQTNRITSYVPDINDSLKFTSYKLNSQAVNKQQVMQPCKIFLVHA